MEAGSFQLLHFTAKGVDFSVVIDGNSANFDEQDFIAKLKRIVVTEMDLMRDVPFKHYTFFYHFPRGRTGGGMEHADSTAINVSADNVSASLDGVLAVSAHEFFHVWNVKRIRPSGLEPIDYTRENYTRDLWFSEGVTSLYGGYTLVRAGLETPNAFLASLARTIQDIEQRPAHLFQSAEQSSLDAWLEKYPFYRRPENSVSYYEKGEILGLLLDLKIREATHNRKSLDDVLRFLNLRYAKRGLVFDDRRGIPDAITAVAHIPLTGFFSKYVSGVDEVDYDSFLKAAGWKLKVESLQAADWGFGITRGLDVPPTIDAIVAGGAGDSAGLKNGDQILEIDGKPVTRAVLVSFTHWDPAVPLKMKVRRGAVELEKTVQPGTTVKPLYSIIQLPSPLLLQLEIREGILTGQSKEH